MRPPRIFVSLAATMILVSFALPAQELLHARVSEESGGALVRGKEDEEWSYASLNTLILPGDTVWVDKSGTLEIEMSEGAFLRLADASKAEIVQLPPDAVVRGWTGAFYLQRLQRGAGSFVFETAACSVDLGRDSMVRVDILAEGATTVTVRWGQATIRTDQGRPVLVTAGKRSFIDPGYLPSPPIYFDRTAEDDFDIWNRERAKLLAIGADSAAGGLKSTVQVTRVPLGVHDLSLQGEWIYIDTVPYWRPTVVVDFIPYRYGHWSYVPRYGYVWVGGYPFSYVTTHYGRWWRHPRHGWVWTYRDVWGPAWCATVRVGPYYVWSPLDVYDRPIVWGTAYFNIGSVRFSLGASSYCSAADLYWGPAVVYAATPDVVVHTDVHIWNLTPGRPLHVQVPYDRPILPVRDYTPQRVIRGPVLGGLKGVVARDRAVSLEESSGRASFAAVSQTGLRGLRTPITSTSRVARVRPTQVDSETALTTRATLRRLTGSEPERESVRASRESSIGRGASVGEAPMTTTRSRSADRDVAPHSTLGRTGDVPRTTERAARTPSGLTPPADVSRSSTVVRLRPEASEAATPRVPSSLERAVPSSSSRPVSPTTSVRTWSTPTQSSGAGDPAPSSGVERTRTVTLPPVRSSGSRSAAPVTDSRSISSPVVSIPSTSSFRSSIRSDSIRSLSPSPTSSTPSVEPRTNSRSFSSPVVSIPSPSSSSSSMRSHSVQSSPPSVRTSAPSVSLPSAGSSRPSISAGSGGSSSWSPSSSAGDSGRAASPRSMDSGTAASGFSRRR